MKRYTFPAVILSTLGLVASLVFLVKQPYLRYNPLTPFVRWYYPVQMAAGESGAAVLNEFGSQLVFFDTQGYVTGLVRRGSSRNDLRCVLSLAVASDSVYVADCELQGGGKYATGMRIVRFGFDGRFLEKVYEETFGESIPYKRVLRNMVWCDGRLYGIAQRDDRLSAVRVADGKLNVVHTFSLSPRSVRNVWYAPKLDLIVATTYDRKVYVQSGDAAAVETKSLRSLPQEAAVAPDGTFYMSSHERNEIYHVGEPGRIDTVLDESADAMACFAGKLYFSALKNPTLQCFDLTTRARRSIETAPFASGLLGSIGLAWGSFAVLTLLLLFAVGVSVAHLIRRRRRNELGLDSADKPLGMLPLYLSNLFLVLIVILVVTFTITMDRYRESCEQVRCSCIKVAETLQRLPPEDLVDRIERIRLTSDCAGEDYMRVHRLISLFCDIGKEVGQDLDFFLFRFSPDAPTRCVMTLSPWLIGEGDTLSPDEDVWMHREEVERNAGENRLTFFTYGNYSFIAVPLKDRDGKTTAVLYFMRSDARILQEQIDRLVAISLDLLSQLLVLVMLFGEIRIVSDFLRIRRERLASGGEPMTMCEVQRPLRVLQNAVGALFVTFLPFLARDCALKEGLSGSLFLTLPLVVRSGWYYVARIFLQGLSQRSVRLGYNLSVVLQIAAAVLLVFFARSGAYWLLIATMVVLASSSGLCACANTSLRASGLTPVPRYRLLVFTNMEPLIGSGIGIALGAFLYVRCGLSAVAWAIILMSVVMAILVKTFIPRDLELPAAVSESPSTAQGSVLRFVLTPVMLAIVLGITMPLNFLMSFQSYVLPVYSGEQGHSMVLLGFLLLIIQLVSLFVLPPTLKFAERFGNRNGIGVSMALMLGALLLYALVPNLVTILIVVVAVCLLGTVIATFVERAEIALAGHAHVSYEGASKYLVIGEFIALSSGAPLFCWLLKEGYSFLGYVLFAASAALLVVYHFCTRRLK